LHFYILSKMKRIFFFISIFIVLSFSFKLFSTKFYVLFSNVFRILLFIFKIKWSIFIKVILIFVFVLLNFFSSSFFISKFVFILSFIQHFWFFNGLVHTISFQQFLLLSMQCSHQYNLILFSNLQFFERAIHLLSAIASFDPFFKV
jgi:hypothetical protein